MTELTTARRNQPAAAGNQDRPSDQLTQAQKAAIVIGIIGSEAAGPLLEKMDETTMRNFATAMSTLRKIEPETVHEIIREFLYDLDRLPETVHGGTNKARELLADYVPDATLTRIMNDVEAPSSTNIWKKLGAIDETALAEFLTREHPQTAAVVLSNLPSDQAAKVLGRVEPEVARDMVFGLTKAGSLDSSVVDAIAFSVSEDFLANQRVGTNSFRPAERIGSIMNFTTGEIRQAVLGFLDQTQPELADAVKGSMFTFQDIHERVERRDIAAIVRNLDQDIVLRALKGAEDNAPASNEFILSSISSRMAEQMREALGEIEKVKIREAEEAQQEFLKVIREMEGNGELKLIEIDD
ncbi:MAG: FliG C-terminal domain-containing protein [Pseudomonadota bacterium]